MSKFNREEFEALVSEYLDSECDSEGIHRLSKTVRENSEARKLYIKNVILHTLLREYCVSVLKGYELADEVNSRGFRRYRIAISLSLAAVVMIIASIILITGLKGVKRDEAEVVAIESVASRRASSDVEWSKLQVGDVIRSGEKIKTDQNGWVKLNIGGKSHIMIASNTQLTISLARKRTWKLETGRLFAELETLSPAAAIVFVTPQASITCRGTQFAIGTEKDTTKLHVLKGKVSIKRQSDGKKVDVATGEYAELTEGNEIVKATMSEVELLKLQGVFTPFVLTKPGRTRYGAVLFDDEFDETLEKWDVVVGTDSTDSKVANENLTPFVILKKNLKHIQNPHMPESTTTIGVDSCAVLHASGRTNQYVKLISRQEIEAERFVVEVGCVFAPTSEKGKSFVKFTGIDVPADSIVNTEEKVGYPWVEYGPIYTVHRWEFRAIGNGWYHCRMFKGGNWKNITGGMFRSCYMKPSSKRVVIDITGPQWQLILDRVRVREIIDDNVAIHETN